MDPREESDWYEPDMWWQQLDDDLRRRDEDEQNQLNPTNGDEHD